jgi:glucokinase
MQILCGDIGGTNTRLMVAEVDGMHISTILQKQYSSHVFGCFEDVLDIFLREVEVVPESACFAVAAPVKGSEAQMTNLSWNLNVSTLESIYGFSQISLINDFSALAYGVPVLDESQFKIIQQGEFDSEAPRIVMGAGTGLGLAQSICHHGTWQVLPSQGGHNAFSPCNVLQCDILEYLLNCQDYVSNEDLLSGKGLVSLYQFYAQRSGQSESARVRLILALDDPAAEISQSGIRGDDELATQALTQFIEIYGAVAGDAALYTLAFGGVFLGGGIAPKIDKQLCTDTFVGSFSKKGKMSKLMSKFPVRIIMNEQVGLLGAAWYAAQS